MIEKYINDFTSMVREPNILLFSLMLANKFNGQVLMYQDEKEYDAHPDIIVMINGKLYDMFGEIDNGTVELDSYMLFDKLSMLQNIKVYNYFKWVFINECNEDQEYYNEMN